MVLKFQLVSPLKMKQVISKMILDLWCPDINEKLKSVKFKGANWDIRTNSKSWQVLQE